MSEEIKDKDQLDQEEKEALLKYEKRIGMLRLKEGKRQLYLNSKGKQGKYWMALSPKWHDPIAETRFNTKYKIVYWVNYGDDETYGWFTVEQIKQWLNDPEVKLHTLGGTKER